MSLNFLFLFLLSCLFLLAGWFFWFWDQKGQPIRMWRRLLSSASLIALSASVLLFARFMVLAQLADEENLAFLTRLEFSSAAPYGFWFATAALLLCWSAPLRAVCCVALSSLVIWFVWLAQGMSF
jgi:hypothetical protein